MIKIMRIIIISARHDKKRLKLKLIMYQMTQIKLIGAYGENGPRRSSAFGRSVKNFVKKRI